MSLKKIIKLKISSKIFIALFGLALISLIIFGYIAFDDMEKLGRYTLARSMSLGESAVSDSIAALREQAEEYLIQVAKDQAAISNALLEKVAAEVMIMVEYATNLWSKPERCLPGESYSEEQKPADIYAHSVYKLAPGVQLADVQEELAASSLMDEIFVALFANDYCIDTLCLGTESGIFRSYPWRTGRDPAYDPRKRTWYRQAVSEGKLIWTEPYIHAATNELIITCAKSFKGPQGKLAGVAEVDVTLEVMNKKIMSTQIGDSGYAFLIDKQGRTIVRPGLVAGDIRWDETYKTENLLESENAQLRKIAEEMVAGKTGIAVCKLDGSDQYIAYAPVTVTDWFMGIVVPVDDIIAPALATKKMIVAATENTRGHIDKRLQKVLNLLSIIFIIIILVDSWTAYRLSKKITRPILALDRGAQIVGRGDLDYRLDIKTGDEIEQLAGTFNKMSADLKVYIKNLKETTAAKERIESELKVAHDIQLGLVPKKFPPFPERKQFDLYAVLDPMKEVGGDFYDFFLIDDNHLCFVIGDVSGKGVPAALFMAMVKTLIKASAKEAGCPAEIMTRVNQEVVQESTAAMFVTVFLGILDIRTGEVTYSNCGHNPPLYVHQGQEPEFIMGGRSTIVGMIKQIPFRSDKLILQPGDTIYLYTDGATEAFNQQREQFSGGRLQEIVSANRKESLKDLTTKTLTEIQAFAGSSPQSDDITIMVLRYFGS